jgi:hypothetical protein
MDIKEKKKAFEPFKMGMYGEIWNSTEGGRSEICVSIGG